ncbi:MAG: TldD/PmbA family protein, partial [Clostridia bacterium]|nr:TldD/PmbA family protein [Clostridia bacterium]
MNFKKFFTKATESGITECEISYSKSSSFSISLFKGEIDNYSSSSKTGILARGVYNGKFGLCTTEKDDRSSIDYLINGIKETATIVESDEEPILFEGSKKYHKGS